MAYSLSIVTNILEKVSFLSEIAQYRVLKASLAYLHDEEYELTEVEESVAFKMLIPMLSDAKAKSDRIAERNRANGSKGGRKKTQTVILETQKTQSVSVGYKESPLSSPSPFSPIPPLSTPPIIPQENPSSPSVRTHTCEEDFGLQVGVIATIEKYEKEYKREGMWRDVACQNHLTIEQAQEIFSQFVFSQKHNSKQYSSFSEFKGHFLNYIRKRAATYKTEQQTVQKQSKVISGSSIMDIYNEQK